jgi:hypothetical protein
MLQAISSSKASLQAGNPAVALLLLPKYKDDERLECRAAVVGGGGGRRGGGWGRDAGGSDKKLRCLYGLKKGKYFLRLL